MRKSLIPIFFLVVLVFSGCQWFAPQPAEIKSFEECVEAGNPIMESYPRQCTANGKTYTEEIDEQPIVDELQDDVELLPPDVPQSEGSKPEYVVCKETVTGFSAEDYAKEVGGICVEVCPDNYDSFTTQTGIEVCIQNYGEAEIQKWQTCERSTDTCECVKAYETTTGEPIDDPQYRCVPANYAERMLFRGGVDRLDENGEQSVAIA